MCKTFSAKSKKLQQIFAHFTDPRYLEYWISSDRPISLYCLVKQYIDHGITAVASSINSTMNGLNLSQTG